MPSLEPAAVQLAPERLDAHVREIVQWHFDPATGCPFWLDRAQEARLRSATDIQTYDDLDKFGSSRTSGCAAGRCGAGCRKAYADKPIYIFETGGSTGVPKSRINIEDFRIDYESLQRHAARRVLSRRAPTG